MKITARVNAARNIFKHFRTIINAVPADERQDVLLRTLFFF